MVSAGVAPAWRAGVGLAVLLAAAGVQFGCSGGDAAVADLAELDPGWNTLVPGGDTVCSDGSDYRFFARPGAGDKLLVYFQGGGACWDGATCDRDREQSPYAANLAGLDPARAHGIFAFDEPLNPFADYSVVFAPYCSGDVHLGDRVASYTAPAYPGHAAHVVTVQHKGMVNAEAVLDWTEDHFFRPQSLFVAGSSAGSIPSPYYAMRLAETYPDAAVAQLGDASSGYRRGGADVTPEVAWGALERLRDMPEFANLAPGEMSFQLLYVAAARQTPRVQFAAFDHAEDSVQKDFLRLAGAPAGSLLPLILENQAEIRRAVPGFRSFIAAGAVHTILLRPEFYSLEADGTRIVDWVSSLAAQREVADVR
jgi:hypothetical protein